MVVFFFTCACCLLFLLRDSVLLAFSTKRLCFFFTSACWIFFTSKCGCCFFLLVVLVLFFFVTSERKYQHYLLPAVSFFFSLLLFFFLCYQQQLLLAAHTATTASSLQQLFLFCLCPATQHSQVLRSQLVSPILTSTPTTTVAFFFPLIVVALGFFFSVTRACATHSSPWFFFSVTSTCSANGKKNLYSYPQKKIQTCSHTTIKQNLLHVSIPSNKIFSLSILHCRKPRHDISSQINPSSDTLVLFSPLLPALPLVLGVQEAMLCKSIAACSQASSYLGGSTTSQPRFNICLGTAGCAALLAGAK